MGVELPLHVVVTILECCVTFSGVKLSIRSFVLFPGLSFAKHRLAQEMRGKSCPRLITHIVKMAQKSHDEVK